MLNLFKTMDTDNSNALTKQELKAGFAKGGAKLTDDNLEKMFLFLDKDDSGTISYEEFREYILMKKKKSKEVGNGKKPNGPTTKVSTKPKEMYTEKKANSASTKEPENVDRYQQKLRNLWSTMDTDKSGTISKTELQVGLSRGGVKLSNQVAEKMFKHMDKDESGTITFDEFVIYMTAKKKATTGQKHEKHQTSFKPKNGPNVKMFLSE